MKLKSITLKKIPYLYFIKIKKCKKEKRKKVKKQIIYPLLNREEKRVEGNLCSTKYYKKIIFKNRRKNSFFVYLIYRVTEKGNIVYRRQEFKLVFHLFVKSRLFLALIELSHIAHFVPEIKIISVIIYSPTCEQLRKEDVYDLSAG